MVIKREQALQLQKIFSLLKNKKFNINTQYKFLKLKKTIEEEQKIYTDQIFLNCDEYFEHDKNGNPIINNDGGYRIKEGKYSDCSKIVEEINSCLVQLPDIYFSIDELEELELNFEELELFFPFIR